MPGDDIQQPENAAISRRQTRLEPGERFAGYRIVHHIARGSYGDVYRARVWGDDVIASEVAIKIPYEQGIDSTKLRLEAELWVACSEHQNIVRLLSAGVADGLFYMASEFIRGGTLRSRLGLNPGKPQVSQRTAVAVARGMLAALEHLHSPRGKGMHGVIHRDLKPENILMTADTPKLTDFGVSAALTSTRGVRTGAGTFAYRAPEDFSDRTDARSDLWAVGVILYEMLSGRLPFFQPNNDAATFSAIMHGTAPPLPQCVPERIVSVVNKALAKAPDDRFQSAAEMHDALEAAVDGLLDVLKRQPECVVGVGARCCRDVQPVAAQPPPMAVKAAPMNAPKESVAAVPAPNGIQDADSPAPKPARQLVPTVADPPKPLVNTVREQDLRTPQREARQQSGGSHQARKRNGPSDPRARSLVALSVALVLVCSVVGWAVVKTIHGPAAIQGSPASPANPQARTTTAQPTTIISTPPKNDQDNGAAVAVLNKSVKSELDQPSVNLGRILTLIHSGADVNTSDSTGWTPLMQASQVGDLDAVKSLVEAGANVNLKDADGQTALIEAAKSGNAKVVQALLPMADVNAHNHKLETALMWAVQNDHADVVRVLLHQPGINVNLSDQHNNTALDFVQSDAIKNMLLDDNARHGKG